MKKILALMAAISLSSFATVSVISCGLQLSILGAPDINRINLGDAEIFDILTTRVDYETLSKEYLFQMVQEELESKLIQNNLETKPKPVLNIDYTIDAAGFDEVGKLSKPTKIVVSATNESKYLQGSYEIIAFLNLNSLSINDLVKIQVGDDFNAMYKKVLAELQIILEDNVLVESQVALAGDSALNTSQKGMMIIEAKKDAKWVGGKISFKIDPRSLNGHDLELSWNATRTLNILKDEVRQHIQNNVFANVSNIQVTNDDFVIEGVEGINDDDLIGIQSKFVVTSSPESNILIDTFNLKINIADLGEIKSVFSLKEAITKNEETNNSMVYESLIKQINDKYHIQILATDLTIKNDVNEEVNLNNLSFVKAGNYTFEVKNQPNLIGHGNFEIQQINLNEFKEAINLNNIQVGENYFGEIIKFNNFLKTEFNGLNFVEGIDYEITGLSEDNYVSELVVKPTTITITGIGDNLTSSINFDVVKRSIDGFMLNSFSGKTWTEIEQEILVTFQRTVFKNLELPELQLQLSDFEILYKETGINGLANTGRYDLEANEDSNLIDGITTLDVENQINLNNLVLNDLEIGDGIQTQLDNMLTQINELDAGLKPELNKDYQIIEDSSVGTKQKGSVTISAVEGSKKLLGSKTFNVVAKDISKLSPISYSHIYYRVNSDPELAFDDLKFDELTIKIDEEINNSFIDQSLNIQVKYGVDYIIKNGLGNQWTGQSTNSALKIVALPDSKILNQDKELNLYLKNDLNSLEGIKNTLSDDIASNFWNDTFTTRYIPNWSIYDPNKSNNFASLMLSFTGIRLDESDYHFELDTDGIQPVDNDGNDLSILIWGDNALKVVANENSTKISGEWSFKINKYDISSILDANFLTGPNSIKTTDTEEEINNKIFNQIVQIFGRENWLTEADIIIEGITDWINGTGPITIKASDDSHFITGTKIINLVAKKQ